jgi:hypothetical protein
VTVLTVVREADGGEEFRVLQEIVAEAVTTGRRKEDRGGQ